MLQQYQLSFLLRLSLMTLFVNGQIFFKKKKCLHVNILQVDFWVTYMCHEMEK